MVAVLLPSGNPDIDLFPKDYPLILFDSFFSFLPNQNIIFDNYNFGLILLSLLGIYQQFLDHQKEYPLIFVGSFFFISAIKPSDKNSELSFS